jgi:hypothetical protein
LDSSARAFFEPRFGKDLSHVRVHTDERAGQSARAVNAHAYTLGQDVILDPARFSPGTAEGQRLLAHELVHTAQQAGHASIGNSLQLGAMDTAQEREAEALSESIFSNDRALHSATAQMNSMSDLVIRRQPNLPGPPASQGQLNLSIDQRGRVDITLAGPENTPIIPQPTIGIRRDATGTYHILVGGKDKVVTVDQIPSILRGALEGSPGRGSSKQKFRVPTCDRLRRWGGKEKVRFMTFGDYQRQQKIFHSQVSSEPWLPLTESLFDAILAQCMSELMEFEVPSAPEQPMQDAPERSLPEGMEYA